jgi:multidrug efflux pump subunit AcrA (membrane-fusion protein)
MTRTAHVRMEFDNPGYLLKPGMFATVQVSAELAPSVLLAPDMAILRSGEKTTVFVALDGGKFEPRTVTLGPAAENDDYQILSGLTEGERIVTSGQFMLDSESRLREAIQKMLVKVKRRVARRSRNAAAARRGRRTATATTSGNRVRSHSCSRAQSRGSRPQ